MRMNIVRINEQFNTCHVKKGLRGMVAKFHLLCAHVQFHAERGILAEERGAASYQLKCQRSYFIR